MARPLNQCTDEELLFELQKEDEAAMSAIVSRFKDPLTNLVYRLSGDEAETNDLVRETFARLFQRRRSYREGRKASTWIFTIAIKIATAQWRRERWGRLFSLRRTAKEPEPVFDIPEERPRPDAGSESMQREEKIQEALISLPMRLRQLVVLRDVLNLSYEEIAGITRQPNEVIQSRITMARARLLELLKGTLVD